jgi:hypothetical protein
MLTADALGTAQMAYRPCDGADGVTDLGLRTIAKYRSWPGPPNSACPPVHFVLAAMRHIPNFRQSPRLLPARLRTGRRVAVADNISAFATRCGP